jgi:hypothetical protein
MANMLILSKEGMSILQDNQTIQATHTSSTFGCLQRTAYPKYQTRKNGPVTVWITRSRTDLNILYSCNERFSILVRGLYQATADYSDVSREHILYNTYVLVVNTRTYVKKTDNRILRNIAQGQELSTATGRDIH